MSILSISKEEFLQIYAGTEVVNEVDLFYPETEPDLSAKQAQKAYATKCFKSKLWRVNSLYTIKAKKKKGEKKAVLISFKMNRGQHIVYATALKHPRLIILKSRQIGISTLWAILFFDDAIFNPNLEIGLISHTLKSAELTLDKVKLLWDKLPAPLKNKVKLKSNSTSTLSFSNGSKIYVKGGYRGTTLHGLHVSEYGPIASDNPKRAEEIITGTLQAVGYGRDNFVIFESTADGPNKFQSLWKEAERCKDRNSFTEDDFMPVFLSWLDDPDCREPVYVPPGPEATSYFDSLRERGFTLDQEQMNFWAGKYNKLEEKMYREYPADPGDAFRVSQKGAYYARIYDEILRKEGKIKEHDMYDNNRELYLTADLGTDDYTVLQYFQVGDDGDVYILHEKVFINSYLKDAADYIKEHTFIDEFGEPKIPDRIFLPHDVKQRDWSANKKPRIELLADEGIEVEPLDKNDIEEGIEETRDMLRNTFIHVSCKYTLDCICFYSKKYDAKAEQFLEKPKRDMYCHGADSLRYMAQSRNIVVVSRRAPPRQTYGRGDVAIN